MMNRMFNGVLVSAVALFVLLAGAYLMLEICDGARADVRDAVVAQESAVRGLVGSGAEVYRLKA